MLTLQDRQAARVATMAAMMAPAPEAAAVAVAEAPDPPVLVPRADAAPRRASLTAKYRPRRLADVVGQDEAVAKVRAFLANGRPKPFLFGGPSGVGKTSLADAIAGEVGVDLDGWCGGMTAIASGDHTADTLRELWPTLWNVPATGSGWRVLVVNEAENFSPAVERLWMDKLENLPPRCVIVFTTNDLVGLPRRFRDRCRVIELKAAGDTLKPAAEGLIGRIWQAEVGENCPAAILDRIIRESVEQGEMSFRRVVEATEEALELREYATA